MVYMIHQKEKKKMRKAMIKKVNEAWAAAV